MKILFVSLGCDKNLVDTEMMLGQLSQEGFTFTDDETEAEIIASRKYYNDIITDYNKMVKSCPSNLVALLGNYKSKDYFDGNNIDKEKGTVKL